MKNSKSGVSRRRFVKGGLVAAAAVTVGTRGSVLGLQDEDTIPTATLGKTGAKVSILGLGTACLGHKNANKPKIRQLEPVFSEAIDRGISYVDTARIYGRAEDALKKVLKTRRENVFLVTKVWAETKEEAEESFYESIDKLGVDSVDLLLLHSCGGKDIDKVLADGGSWKFMQGLKKQGKTRFVGLSGHSRPANFVRMIRETKEVDAIMIAMNFVDYNTYGFEEKVLPVARALGVGVMCMKVFGGIQGGFKNYTATKPFPSQMPQKFHRDAIRYAKGLKGVSGYVLGVHSAAQLRQNIKMVRNEKPFSKDEMTAARKLGKELAEKWGPRFGPVR